MFDTMDIYDDIYIPLEGKELPILKAEFQLFVNFLNEHNIDYCLGGAIGFCEYSTPRMCTQTDFVLSDQYRQQLHAFLEAHDFELLPASNENAIGIRNKQVAKWEYSIVFSFLAENELKLLQSSLPVQAFETRNLPLLTPFALLVTTLNALADGSVFYGTQLRFELYDMIKKRLVNHQDVVTHLTKIGSFKQLAIFEEETQTVEDHWRDERNGIKSLSWGELQRRKKKENTESNITK